MAVEPRTLPLADLPEGIIAERVRRLRTTDTGEQAEVLVRRRHRRTDEVELVAAGEPAALEDIDPSEQRWLLDAGARQWRTVEARYGDGAWVRAIDLVRGGVVRLRCRVNDRMGLGEPRSWTLTGEWERLRQDAYEQRERDREYWRARAEAAGDAVEERCPELAEALRKAPGGATTAVLVHAAEDLAQGVIHPSPRAFSQSHFKDTKARDDVADILARAGVPEDILIALGIRRSARIGVAGPVRAIVGGEGIELGRLHGPVLVRVDQPQLQLRLSTPAALVVVENLQAAEALADQLPQLAVAYTAGFPSDGALRLLAGLATDASRVVLVPDADLGGVRIAERVLGVVPGAELVDIGLMDAPRRDPWPADSDTERALRAALDGPAGDLARGCLMRGYPVEQELATVEAVQHALS